MSHPPVELPPEVSRRLQRLSVGMSVLTLVVLGSAAMGALVLVTGVLPGMVQMFEGMNLQLPLATRILIALTKSIRSPLGLLVAVAALAILAAAYVALAVALWRRARADGAGALEVQTLLLAVVLGFVAFASLGLLMGVLMPLFQLVGNLA